MMQNVRYSLEAVLLYGCFALFKILPVETASNFGGWLGRTIGVRMGASRKALKHLELAFPDKTDAERHEIMVGMWDNLGRVFAEYPHIPLIAKSRTVIESAVDLSVYKESETPNAKGAVFAGAHIGNWEIGCAAPYLQLGMEVDSAYRAPNNPWSERLLLRSRTLNNTLKSYTKSRSGGIALLRAAKAKRNCVILFDQKYNEGVNVPFFGHDAMTNPIFVQLGQKYGLDVLPVHIVREGSARFRLIVEKPMALFDETGAPRPEADIIQDAHALLEGWIREHPDQWIWLHRRWKG